MLADRLQSVMAKLTGLYQSSFVSGQLAVDNVVIAHELLHHLKSRKGNRCGMVVKLDLEKAYDKVD